VLRWGDCLPKTMVEGSGKVCVDGGEKVKGRGAARYPELGAEVPNVNSTGEVNGAICVPLAWKGAQWCGALAAGGAACNPIHCRPHR